MKLSQRISGLTIGYMSVSPGTRYVFGKTAKETIQKSRLVAVGTHFRFVKVRFLDALDGERIELRIGSMSYA